MNEELMNSVENEVVEQQVVEPVEVVNTKKVNRDAIAFGIGAGAGAGITLLVTSAPKLYRWGQQKVDNIKRKRKINKALKQATNELSQQIIDRESDNGDPDEEE